MNAPYARGSQAYRGLVAGAARTPYFSGACSSRATASEHRSGARGEHQEAAIQPSRHPDLEPATEPSAPATDEAAKSQGIGRQSAHGFLWGTLAWTGNRLAILGLTLLLARLLAPEDFGVVTAALTVIAILDAALDLGVGAASSPSRGPASPGGPGRPSPSTSRSPPWSASPDRLRTADRPVVPVRSGRPDLRVDLPLPALPRRGQVNDAVLKRDLRFRSRPGWI
jgi:hypothetical protein